MIRHWVQRRLGGYRHSANFVDPALAVRSSRSVAVIGAGLAGLTAAVTLARRGCSVELFEAHDYLGGKIGAWPVALGGETQFVEHGFHAFFHHYYNLNAFLDSLGLRKNFQSIGDYAIVALDGSRYSFAGVDKTPLLNLLSMRKQKLWSLSRVLKQPRLAGILAMFRYDPAETFRRYDGLSYKAWADQLGIPASMRLMFNSFSRAFFATPDRMSTAELLKSFHSFFLSHDGGLVYDYPTDDYDATFLTPLRRELEKHGARIHLGRPVGSVVRDSGFVVEGTRFDSVVLATNSKAARALVEASPTLKQGSFRRQMAALVPSQGYAVLRLWTNRALETDLPAFIITEHRRVLDSVSFYDRLEGPSKDWAERHNGAVYELHCYALPDGLDNEGVRAELIEEFLEAFPSLRGSKILHEHLQVNHDFTALHMGLHGDRPATETGIPGLVLAGDWVKLPFPAMLMEAAASSGLLAANALLRAEDLREEPVWSVPPRGLFA